MIFCKIATTESIISNARYAVRDGDRGEGGATIERFISNTRHAVRDGDGGKGRANSKCPLSNARYAIGDGDEGEGGALIESIISNASNAVRNSGILTTCNKGVSFSFDNCIAVVTAIVDSITFFYKH